MNKNRTMKPAHLQPSQPRKGGVHLMMENSEHMEKVMHACEEMNANCCKSVDALMEAAAAVSKGCEEFSRKLGTMMQESMACAMNKSKTMMSAKSVKEFNELQAEFTKELFDQWLAGTGRLSEISARVTHEAFTPVAKHANDAMSKMAQCAQQTRAA
jgi:phasin family protein